MVEAVVCAARAAFRTAAADVMRLLDAIAAIQKDLDDFVIVAVRCEDYGCDIGCERTGWNATQKTLKTRKLKVNIHFLPEIYSALIFSV